MKIIIETIKFGQKKSDTILISKNQNDNCISFSINEDTSIQEPILLHIEDIETMIDTLGIVRDAIYRGRGDS